MTWDVIECMSRIELLRLAKAYSDYVIDAIDRDVEPVCIAEYYDNDYELIQLRQETINLILSDKCYYSVVKEALVKYLEDWDEDTLKRFLGIKD